MRIVYILTSLGIGGAEKVVLALGRSIVARGGTVVVLVLRSRMPEEWPTELHAVHLDMRKTPFSVLAALMRGRRFLRGFLPDIVHSHGFHGNMAARVFRLLGVSPKPISTIHNVYEGGWLRMLAYRCSDSLSYLTTAVSAAAAERFVRLKAVPAQKCVVLPNGIDLAEFTPDGARRERVRAEMSCRDEFVWLTAGRIVPAKDYPNLLRAFAEVFAAIPASQLWIAGEPADPGEADGVRSLIAELGIENSTKCLGLRRDVPALLDGADAFVLASAWEGMPLAVGEAMAMEKPVVATDAGGTRDLVDTCGSVVPPRDPRQLAEAMIRVQRSSLDSRRSLGRAARARIEQYFSIDAKCDEWERLYRRPSQEKTR
jgi:glycosyltransferase involved in cell wall biosynthesis